MLKDKYLSFFKTLKFKVKSIYGKTPIFSGKQHFYSYFQNPNESSIVIHYRCFIYPANNVKMPTVVGILTFMSRINFMLSWVADEHEKSFKTSRQDDKI